jgi:hypothetical protein
MISIFKYQSPIQRRIKKLSIDDKIKIPKVLKILENYLENFILAHLFFKYYHGYLINA